MADDIKMYIETEEGHVNVNLAVIRLDDEKLFYLYG